MNSLWAVAAYAQYDVGTTVGTLDVSPNGGASYTVPIAVPPGVKDIAPSVALGNFHGGVLHHGAHGLTGGVMAELQGGDFGSGFASGFISHTIAAKTNALQVGMRPTLQILTTLASGTLSGGISSKLAGGSWVMGLRQGFSSTLLNELSHTLKDQALEYLEGHIRENIRIRGNGLRLTEFPGNFQIGERPALDGGRVTYEYDELVGYKANVTLVEVPGKGFFVQNIALQRGGSMLEKSRNILTRAVGSMVKGAASMYSKVNTASRGLNTTIHRYEFGLEMESAVISSDIGFRRVATGGFKVIYSNPRSYNIFGQRVN